MSMDSCVYFLLFDYIHLHLESVRFPNFLFFKKTSCLLFLFCIFGFLPAFTCFLLSIFYIFHVLKKGLDEWIWGLTKNSYILLYLYHQNFIKFWIKRFLLKYITWKIDDACKMSWMNWSTFIRKIKHYITKYSFVH